MAPTLQRSHTTYMSRRRPHSQEFLSGRFSTVRLRPATPCSSICAHYVWFIPGMLVVLFFKCIAALLNPLYRKRDGIKWVLVSHTVVTFSFVTVYTAMNLNAQSTSFIDNREFTDPNGTLVGPLGYWLSIRLTVLGTIPNLTLLLNNLLADGLLVGPLLDAASACPGV